MWPQKENISSEIMDFNEILKVITDAGKNRKTVEIYYPKTESSPEGWREIEPYNLNTDTEDEGDILTYGIDNISPGHILNAYTRGSKDNSYHSFILGKINRVRKTTRRFNPKKNWKFNF